jgi:CBS domain-containing protein
MSVEHAHCDHPKVGDIRNSSLSVGDVMVTRPKTMPASATVGDLRRTFANPHVISAVLVDGASFAGMVHRAALADLASNNAGDDAPARELVDIDTVTVRPSTPLPDAVAILDAAGSRRLVVVADDGTSLAGLLCLDESRSSFCQ